MKKSSILMMLMALFMSVTSFAQGIKGTVIDENGEPVIGATVAEKSNAKNATITDLCADYPVECSPWFFTNHTRTRLFL